MLDWACNESLNSLDAIYGKRMQVFAQQQRAGLMCYECVQLNTQVKNRHVICDYGTKIVIFVCSRDMPNSFFEKK